MIGGLYQQLISSHILYHFYSEVLTHLHACIMKSCMPEVLYHAYVPCILHRYASATEMGLQHTCDVPPSVKAWMVLCMEYLHAADTETFRMYADIISRGVYAKCNLQIICEMFCNHSWLLACVYAFLKALALDLRVMIIILQNFQDLRLSDFLHVCIA